MINNMIVEIKRKLDTLSHSMKDISLPKEERDKYYKEYIILAKKYLMVKRNESKFVYN